MRTVRAAINRLKNIRNRKSTGHDRIFASTIEKKTKQKTNKYVSLCQTIDFDVR